jgi:predicted ATPase
LAILRRVVLKGFKSIKTMDLELRPLNVLIGPNGAGKSNLVSFFKMLNRMMSKTNTALGHLQTYIAEAGYAHSLLYYGPKETPQMESTLEFETNAGLHTYYLRLFHVAGDTLAFAEETLDFRRRDWQGPPKPPLSISSGGDKESRIGEEADRGNTTAKVFRHLLSQCRVFHFHDTSPTARIRQYGYVGENRWLMPDAGNLAAFLLRLREEDGGAAYKRIVTTIRLIAPFFIDFVLEPAGPNKNDIMLNWLADSSELNSVPGTGGSEQVFGPHQLSDGTLRAMCLVALLMQPENELPDLIIVEEPELGLHPYALKLVAALFKKASHHTQVLISTQSSSFLDNFDPEDVVVVGRVGNESLFERQTAEKLESWLEDYSLGEVWEKNIIGGGPH